MRAQSLQSWPTLCDPMDCSLPDSSVHGILLARTLECKNSGMEPVSHASPAMQQILYHWAKEEVIYAKYIMQNARLDESEGGIKIARRNINNLRYPDDTNLMTKSEEELKSLLKLKEDSEKAGLKFNIQKTKITASRPNTSWQIDRETMETVSDFIFLGSKITADDDYSNEL